MQLNDRWSRFGTSIFSVMTQAANAAQAVNLAQGFPDFSGPGEIIDAAVGAMRQGHNQYAPAHGILPLREALATRMERRSGLKFNPETEVTVFSGATEAIFSAIQAFCAPGDEVLTFAPYFDSYPAAAFAAGATLRGLPLEPPHWAFTEAALEQAVTARTKVILVNTPHNPTGRVLGPDELAAIARIAQRYDLIVLTDEVYDELYFAPAKHRFFAAEPGMRERTVTVSSCAKTFSMTGWKIGYGFASPELTQRLRAVHQFTVFCSATPLQHGMLAAFNLSENYFQDLRRDYAAKLAQLSQILEANRFRCSKTEGSYFIVADYSQLSDLPDVEFSHWLTKTAKVACVPISGFYDDPKAAASRLRYVRFAFCKQEATLRAAGENLSRLL